MNRKDGPGSWQEALVLDLEQMMGELRAEVLAEYRQQIKDRLRREVEKRLSQALGSDDFGLQEAPVGADFCADDFPGGPEVTVMAGIREGSAPSSTQTWSPGAELLYTYCFIREGNPDLGALEGIAEGTCCCVVRQGHVAAVLSPVGEEEFGEEALEAKLKDTEWVKEKVQAHQRVIEQIMLAGPVIPLKFCTIFRGAGRVEDFLRRNNLALTQLLMELQGMEEWGVKLYCHRTELLNTVGAGRGTEEAGSAQGAGYMKRKRLERLVEEEAERVLDNATEEMFDSLKPMAKRWVVNEPLSREVTGRQEEMITHVVFLLKKSHVADFCRIIEDLENKLSDLGIVIEATGPWPPYNFAEFQEVPNE